MCSKVLLFIPAFNCSSQLPKVFAQLDDEWVQELIFEVLIVENRSTDRTLEVAKSEACKRYPFVTVMQNVDNYGLGGSHKIAFSYARSRGYDWIIVLHGDDQGSLVDIKKVLDERIFLEYDAVLGARFMAGSSLIGYSRFRIFGNRIFNIFYSILLGQKVYDLGSGLNLFRLSALPLQVELAPDDLTFNCVLLANLIGLHRKLLFIPVSWREDDQISNVKLLRQSLKTFLIPIRFRLNKNKFAQNDFRDAYREYNSEKII